MSAVLETFEQCRVYGFQVSSGLATTLFDMVERSYGDCHHVARKTFAKDIKQSEDPVEITSRIWEQR